MNSPYQLPAMCFDLNTTVRLLRAASWAQVMSSKTRVEWVEDDGAIRYVYGAFLGLFGTPGTAELVIPDARSIESEVQRLTSHRTNVFLTKATQGPLAAANYLSAMNEIRVSSLDDMRSMRRDVDQINRDIARAWGTGVEFLSNTKLVATLTVKALGQIPGPGWLVDMGYDIAIQSIDDLSKANRAKGVVIFNNTVAEGIEEAAGRGSEKVVDLVNRGSTQKELSQAMARMRTAEDKLSSAGTRIMQRRRDIAHGYRVHQSRQSIKALERSLPKRAANLDKAQKSVLKSGTKFALAKAVSWVFLANEVMDAIETNQREVDAARR